jgi:hypothetical protein
METTEISLLCDDKQKLEDDGVLNWKGQLEVGMTLSAVQYDAVILYEGICKQLNELIK